MDLSEESILLIKRMGRDAAVTKQCCARKVYFVDIADRRVAVYRRCTAGARRIAIVSERPYPLCRTHAAAWVNDSKKRENS